MKKVRQPGGNRTFKNRLPVGAIGGIVDVQIYDKHSLTHKPPYRATASLKRCRALPVILWQTFKKRNQSCCTNRVTPRTTRQPYWNHVDRGNLVQHPVDTMLERAVSMTFKTKPGE